MIEVNAALIQKVADLARLELTSAEAEAYARSIGEILKHVEQLNQLDTVGVEPMNYGVDGGLRLREDRVQPLSPGSDGKPRILESAPEVMLDGFKVPQMVG